MGLKFAKMPNFLNNLTAWGGQGGGGEKDNFCSQGAEAGGLELADGAILSAGLAG